MTDTAHCPNCGSPLPHYWSQYIAIGFYRCRCHPKRAGVSIIKVHRVKRWKKTERVRG